MPRPATYAGRRCETCGSFTRYAKTGRCVHCTTARMKKVAATFRGREKEHPQPVVSEYRMNELMRGVDYGS